MVPSEPLPPLAIIERALRETTEQLAHECASPTLQTPSWSESEWRVAPAVASMHGLSGLLSQQPSWRGPPAWQGFLRAQHQQTLQQQQRIFGLLHRVDEAAREAHVPMLGLKGVALQGLGLYAPGTRPMADIDLLVADADQARAAD